MIKFGYFVLPVFNWFSQVKTANVIYYSFLMGRFVQFLKIYFLTAKRTYLICLNFEGFGHKKLFEPWRNMRCKVMQDQRLLEPGLIE